jgi:hypothetical protein
LVADPGEARDLRREGGPTWEALRREALDLVRALRARADESRQRRISLREQRERLRALGYLTDAEPAGPAALGAAEGGRE